MAATTLAAPSASVAKRKLTISPSLWIFRTLHLWVGLSFGLLLVAQGLSGAALVWRPELDRWMLPMLTQAPAGSALSAPFAHLDEEWDAVQRAVPGAAIRGVRLPGTDHDNDEWIVQVEPGTQPTAARTGLRWTVYTSPFTGQLLGIRGKRKDALQWLVELHHNLLLGSFGRSVQGVLAVATMLLALSGLWLWWPQQFTWSRFQPRATARPLHYATGFWAMWPLLAIAFTALYLTWRQPIQHLLGLPSGRQGTAPEVRTVAGEHAENASRKHSHNDGPPVMPRELPGPKMRAAGNMPASLLSVLRAAQIAAPDAKLTTLRLPEEHGPFVVTFEAKAEHYREAPNSMALRAMPDGRVRLIHLSLWRDLPAAQRFLDWLPRVHEGEFGGVLVRALWSITGFVPAVLYLSGFLMWRRRYAAERRFQLSQ